MASELHRMSYAEYLALERASETKHEYVNGEVYAMAGGSPEHARLALQFGTLANLALRGRPCATFSSDARIRIEHTKRATYPDLSIVCGKLERAKDDADAITNPRVFVEVLSESTEASDRARSRRARPPYEARCCPSKDGREDVPPPKQSPDP